MKKVIFLSSKNYNDPSKNCGDCILIDNSSELVIFDCGCEDHAKQVENYMIYHNYDTAKIVLSHNDADHFDGIPYLVDKGLISEVYTLLYVLVSFVSLHNNETAIALHYWLSHYYSFILLPIPFHLLFQIPRHRLPRSFCNSNLFFLKLPNYRCPFLWAIRYWFLRFFNNLFLVIDLTILHIIIGFYP